MIQGLILEGVLDRIMALVKARSTQEVIWITPKLI